MPEKRDVTALESQGRSSSTLLLDALREAAARSRRSLDKIGEGDWTPQDGEHLALVWVVESVLADEDFLDEIARERGWHKGRIIHGDADD